MRKLRALLWAALGVALIYLGYTLADRYFSNRRLEEAARGKPIPAYAKLPAFAAGQELKIAQFYAVPASIARGEKAILCYSVLNAKSVELDPPVDRVWPSLSRCFDIRPEKDTRYTLTAHGAGGKTASESFVLKIHPPR